MSRGPPNTTHQQNCNAAAATTNRHQPNTKRTQTEIPPGKQDFQSMKIPSCQTQTSPQQKKPPQTQQRKAQHNANMQPQNCRDPGSNRGPSDLRSDALPAELSRPLVKQPPNTQTASGAPKHPNATTTLPGRLELPTLRLTASRSNQLSYGSTHTCDQTRTSPATHHRKLNTAQKQQQMQPNTSKPSTAPWPNG